MTSEKKLREITVGYLRRGQEDLAGDLAESMPDSPEARRVADLVRTWPILDLPVPDRDGCLFPLHGRNYGHVRRTDVRTHPDADAVPGVIIARGGPGKASGLAPIRLTRAEALELASLLTAAATEGDHQ